MAVIVHEYAGTFLFCSITYGVPVSGEECLWVFSGPVWIDKSPVSFLFCFLSVKQGIISFLLYCPDGVGRRRLFSTT